MILLTSTSDKVQIITGAAGQIDVHASYIDLSGITVTPGRKNTTITTAATTDIVAAPAASTSRNVKSLLINNSSATVANTITLQLVDGSGTYVLETVTLGPLERLSYDDGDIRYFDSLGREKTGPLSGAWGNSNTANVAANSADTYLTGSQLVIAGRIQPGSGFRWRFRATKTAAGVAAATFNIRLGTAGSTADTSRCLHTSPAAQTAVSDTGVFSLDASFFAVGATAQLQSILDMQHTVADATGMGTFHTQVLSSAFDVTPSGTIIGVSCNPGASGVWTFNIISVQAINLLN